MAPTETPTRDAAELALSRGLGAQRTALARALAGGMPRAGWKVGLNVPEVQARLGLGGSQVGWLDGRSVLASGATYAARADQRIHVEAELALRLAAPVAAGCTPDEARCAIGEIAPALELVDYALPRDGLEAIVSHSMFHAATVLGEASPLSDGVPEAGFPRVFVGGALRAGPEAGWVPRDLGALLSFVAARLAETGDALRAGDLVLSGSYTRPLPVDPGDRLVADFGPLGCVSAAFTKGEESRS